MAIDLNTITCPSCGASLSAESGRDEIFCTYCGSKVIITKGNERIYRRIDEAELKHAETDQMVRLKQMELAEKNRESTEKRKGLKIKISIVLLVVGLLMLIIGGVVEGADFLAIVGFWPFIGIAYIWIFSGLASDDDKVPVNDGKIAVPSAIEEYEDTHYAAIVAILQSVGFTKIQCIPLNDLKEDDRENFETVRSIIINGEEVDCGGRRFPPDASIVISYHSLRGK